MQRNEKHFGDHFAATSKMFYFGPFGAYNCVFRLAIFSPFWHYVFSGFSETRSILKSSRLLQKPSAPLQKHKNEDGRGAKPIEILAIFWKTLILSFLIGNMKSPFSSQFWALLHPAKKCQLHTQSNPEGGAKDERPKICFEVPY